MADVQAGTGEVQGNVAHDAVDSGNPNKIGGKARQAPPAQVANNDRVDAYLDRRGRVVVEQGVGGDTLMAIATISGVTPVQVIASPGAGKSIHVLSVVITNGSSDLTRVFLTENSGGTTKFDAHLGKFGMVSHRFASKWTLAANTGLFIDQSVAVTDIRITVEYKVDP